MAGAGAFCATACQGTVRARDQSRIGCDLREGLVQQPHHFQVAAHGGAPAHHHRDQMGGAARHRTDQIEADWRRCNRS